VCELSGDVQMRVGQHDVDADAVARRHGECRARRVTRRGDDDAGDED
jgi:hypothetical protein